MSDNRKFWWSELPKWDDRVEREWVQWIELVAGLSAMIVLTLCGTVTRNNSSFSEAGCSLWVVAYHCAPPILQRCVQQDNVSQLRD
jgi:hypothetical protein